MKCFIWDWNGTLLDDIDYVIEKINLLLVKYHLSTINKEIYTKIFTFPVIEYYKRLGFDFNLHPFEKVGSEYIELYNSDFKTQINKKIRLHEGAKEVLSTIKKIGHKQVIISARFHDSLLEDLENFGIKHYFDEIYGIENIYAYSKEHILENFIKQNSNFEKTFYIGDTFHDYEIAQKFNINFFYYTKGHQNLNGNYPAIKKINNLKEILNFLE